MPIPRVTCCGTPYEIGQQHGSQAKTQVEGSIQFYANLFQEYTGRSWNEIRSIAEVFSLNIKMKWPDYFSEMRGIADGAKCPLADIVALNVRTEIAFGLMEPERLVSDGCTSLGWCSSGFSKMGQNWDWMEEQKDNIIFLTVKRPSYPEIKMVSEGGIIGKIGMNSEGVGVCLNAVRCLGNEMKNLPVHLALRMVLDSRTLKQAVDNLEKAGTAGSAFILVGQDENCVGLEFTSQTCVRLEKDVLGRVMHSNHLLCRHPGAKEWPEDDSYDRIERLEELTRKYSEQEQDDYESGFASLFDDHDGKPMSICRKQEGASHDATLFNIVMDLQNRSVVVKVGKPCAPDEIIKYGFEDEVLCQGGLTFSSRS